MPREEIDESTIELLYDKRRKEARIETLRKTWVLLDKLAKAPEKILQNRKEGVQHFMEIAGGASTLKNSEHWKEIAQILKAAPEECERLSGDLSDAEDKILELEERIEELQEGPEEE